MDAHAMVELRGPSEFVAVLQGSLPYIKELVAKCTNAGIPVATGCPPGQNKGCCTTIQLLAAPEDVPRIARLLQTEWLDMVAREGIVDKVGPGLMTEEPEGEPPCPACGVAAALVDGECSGCGLFLGA